MNTTNSSDSMDCLDTWSTIVFTSNSASLIVNILHICILMRLNILKDRPYRHLLIHITLADLASALSLLIYYSCTRVFRSHDYNAAGIPHGIKFIAVQTSIAWPFYTYYCVFLIASVEQFYAICRPMRYTSSLFIQKISCILKLTWLVVLILFCLQFTLTNIYSTSLSVFFTILGTLDCVYKLLPCTITAALQTQNMIALSRMLSHQPTNDFQEVRNTAIYLSAIFFVFAIYTLLDISVTVYDMSYDLKSSFLLDKLRNTIKPFYGILNTVIYGWRTKAYRQHIHMSIKQVWVRCHSVVCKCWTTLQEEVSVTKWLEYPIRCFIQLRFRYTYISAEAMEIAAETVERNGSNMFGHNYDWTKISIYCSLTLPYPRIALDSSNDPHQSYGEVSQICIMWCNFRNWS